MKYLEMKNLIYGGIGTDYLMMNGMNIIRAVMISEKYQRANHKKQDYNFTGVTICDHTDFPGNKY